MILGLVLAYHCNARCESCLWGDLLNDTSRMTVEDIRRFIDLASEIEEISFVGFSGGEPTIFRRELISGIEYATKKYGLITGLSTNASWAKSAKQAEKVLSQYVNAGLKWLQISHDSFHEQWISSECIRYSIEAAVSLGIRASLVCVKTRTSAGIMHYIQKLGLIEHELVEFCEVPCTPVGYAATRIASNEFERSPGIPNDYCSMLQVVNVLPDASIRLCCGAPFHFAEFAAGNLKDESLEACVHRARRDPLNRILVEGVGPSKLVSVLGPTVTRASKSNYATGCEACADIFQHSGASASLREALRDRGGVNSGCRRAVDR